MVMRIKEHRIQAEMTQVQLGVQMGVAQPTVAGWETEVILPRARQLPRLARVLGCSINDLFVPVEDAG